MQNPSPNPSQTDSMQCPFCQVPESEVLFRNEQVFAIWDRYPVADGHLLIITNRHIESWFEATEDEHLAIIRALAQGRKIINEEFSVDEYNIGVNVGQDAGQTIPHLHVHLIPRNKGDVIDPRGGVRHVIPGKGYYLNSPPAGISLLRENSGEAQLVRGSDDPFLPHLRGNIDRAMRVDIAVAFILKSGVALIRDHLADLIRRGGLVRIVTGDYFDVTDPDALVELNDLGENLQLRVFEAADTSYHPKSYIFYDSQHQGTAFVGSSNLTQNALRGGIEWNYRVLEDHADRGFVDVANAFDQLFNDQKVRAVDAEWIDEYRKRRRTVDTVSQQGVQFEVPEAPPQPHVVQQEALAALQATRMSDNEAGLVVLATGLGKTWLSAFDSSRPEFERVLFVAHREEILSQAMRTFRRIRPHARLGLYNGKEKTKEADILFASVQTLSRSGHLQKFSRDHFDYVIVDEFHHASAKTYQRLISYFTPRFLLGLTATPERMDGGDLLALCQQNLVYRKDLVAGIEAGLLCAFKYFGVPDVVDYQNIPWRSSKFDTEALTNAVATQRRAENALEQYRKNAGDRTLAFCCSQTHADFMADFFVEAGVRAVAVHSGRKSAPRATALESLENGEIDIIFAVDMFNEGLDLPTIDTVMMLRPTESSIIWLQQFGRGLRVAAGKSELRVIDYIGNHRVFLLKVRSLLQPLLDDLDSDFSIANAIERIQKSGLALPPGCEITYELEAIDLIKSLLRVRGSDDVLKLYYKDFHQRHDRRPTAVEMFSAGYNPRALKKSHGSWLRFVRAMGDLNEMESDALSSCGEFLDTLESTPMSKSYKMVLLLAVLNRDGLPGSVPIDDVTSEFQVLVRRSQKLRADVGGVLNDRSKLKVLIESNPVKAWCGGKGTGGVAYFSYANSLLETNLAVDAASRESFQDLVRELVDWRLSEYLARDASSDVPNSFQCRVIHSSGNPILKLPDRKKVSGIPEGWNSILVAGESYTANFVKQAVNVIRDTSGDGKNVIGDLMRGMFGPDAGKPGTRYQVRFKTDAGGLSMEPAADDNV
ncbi:DEAD/DEAH box helicase family protein [bacterium]|nr:DEAD/DEAH box helicase family protein [bacterium]